jgi:hypothetical protein
MEPNTRCQAQELHDGHICELLATGDESALASATDAPTVFCTNCGEAANTARFVCSPSPITE